MRNRMLLLTGALLLLAAMLTGCTLARPELSGTESQGDMLCGVWLIYDRQENIDNHVFDPGSKTEQMLLLTQEEIPGAESVSSSAARYNAAVSGIEIGINTSDEGIKREIKGTMHVLMDENQDKYMEVDQEIWLMNSVVETFIQHYLEKPEGVEDDAGWLTAGQSAILYLSQEQKDKHGAELTALAEKAGVKVTLLTQSPRHLVAVPVRMRPDGTLYADDGGRRRMQPFTGGKTGLTISDTHTLTINGKSKKESMTVSIWIEGVDALQSARLVEMGADHTAVSTRELSLQALGAMGEGEHIHTPAKEAAYLLVEETFETPKGERYIKRTAYSAQEKKERTSMPSHVFRLPLDNGLTETVVMNFGF